MMPAIAGPMISVPVSIAVKNEFAGRRSRLPTTVGITANIAGRKNAVATEMSARSTYTNQMSIFIRDGMKATSTARARSAKMRIFFQSNQSTSTPAPRLTNTQPTNIEETARETAETELVAEKTNRAIANQLNR